MSKIFTPPSLAGKGAGGLGFSSVAVLAILTTNLKESLDQAFLRRIRFIVKFPFPDGKSRAEIWSCIFPK
ncbi:hypothetical protein IQ257_03700 [Coleofasciculus sp. LEGE 07092]|nr:MULTISPECIES: hypothetical protein [unclassified Coleofasciculus]MBE9125047.1 hypothetical protein [Coleofasciculus sp. LEGE 07081]MBE9147633.1 hypothetical protein [Coleofasciculus sp. LEGE 07092]